MKRVVARCCSRLYHRSRTRSLSSSSAGGAAGSTSSSSSSSVSLPRNSTSLGLDTRFVKPHLASIVQLPEVEQVLSSSSSSHSEHRHTEELLRRAVDIFQSFNKGGTEEQACLALLAEHLQRTGRYSDASKLLLVLEEYCRAAATKEQTADVTLARAKAAWFGGDFDTSESICNAALESDVIESLSPLYEASLRNGYGLCRLLCMDTVDDAYSVRDPFRGILKSLERMPTLALAMAQLNFGTAEAVYSTFLQEKNNMDAPLDAAMRSWKQGLTTLKRVPSSNKDVDGRGGTAASSIALEIRLTNSMAWGCLQMSKVSGNGVEQASEFASKALKLNDDNKDALGGFKDEGLRRTLTLLAICCHRSSSAVTAEGLFQSAVENDDKCAVSNPLSNLELRDAFVAYSELCRDWDRREHDADRLVQQASDVDGSLPPGWRGKSGIHSSLWFWTPSL